MGLDNVNLERTSSFPDACSRTRTEVIELSHTWTIESFGFYQEETALESSAFSAPGCEELKWRLILHPGGFDEESDGWVSILLNLDSRVRSGVQAQFEISFWNSEHEEIAVVECEKPYEFEKGQRSWGFRDFLRRDDLLYNLNKLPRDDLTVRCVMWFTTSSVKSVSSEYTSFAVRDDRVRSHMSPDVVLTVYGEEFHAHKAVLAARSPVFKDMFEQASDRTERFEILDVDADTFRELLSFIYTGTSETFVRMTNFLAAFDQSVPKPPREVFSVGLTEMFNRIRARALDNVAGERHHLIEYLFED